MDEIHAPNCTTEQLADIKVNIETRLETLTAIPSTEHKIGLLTMPIAKRKIVQISLNRAHAYRRKETARPAAAEISRLKG